MFKVPKIWPVEARVLLAVPGTLLNTLLLLPQPDVPGFSFLFLFFFVWAPPINKDLFGNFQTCQKWHLPSPRPTLLNKLQRTIVLAISPLHLPLPTHTHASGHARELVCPPSRRRYPRAQELGWQPSGLSGDDGGQSRLHRLREENKEGDTK